jgi:uncharacterized protein YjbI with pentapeptide repeats
LAGADFTDADLGYADLTDANLWRADLTDIKLWCANLTDINLLDTDLTDANLMRADLTDASLGGADLTDASLGDADLTDTYLKDADLTDTELWDTDLTDADLKDADLTDANLLDADLTDANLGGADLTDVALLDADLTDADFQNATLEKTILHSANLTDANLKNTALTDTILEQANLTRANLFQADLTGAELYGAVLANIQFDKGTEFGGHYADELTSETVPEDSADRSPWDKARWSNRQLERLARENALPEQAREAFKRRKDIRRREHWHRTPIPDTAKNIIEDIKKALGSPRRWLRDYFSDHPVGHLWMWGRTASSGLLMRYGESPGRVVAVSVVFILVWTLLYPIPGIRETPGSQSLTYADVFASDLPHGLGVLGTHLYFSTVTFTTLGYGDFQPVGWARLLATVESYLGALLMALLVFVLGRRATW